ncbi:MAG: hypothetical protein HKO59_03175 [Phycisphaerales bacterium]|nr:ribbon-helix-helix domain-containing protein [Phycisphaerae bacterium]NNF41451.1 hypothetical protein [Phycisphaerales bacterium]NNM24983.1 hypothetical protein [Phycisphaerales bacterium]
MPDDLFERADRLAQRMELSRSELYQRALREFVAEHDEEAVTETLNRLHDQREKDEPGSLDRVSDRLRHVWLDVDEW